MNQMSTFITTAYLDWWGNNGGRKMKQRERDIRGRGRERDKWGRDNKIYMKWERIKEEEIERVYR